MAKSKTEPSPVEKDSKKSEISKPDNSKMVTKPVTGSTTESKSSDDAVKSKLRSILSENPDLENKTPTKDDNIVSPATRALLSRDKKKAEKTTPPPPPSKLTKPDDKEKQARKSISLTSLIKGKGAVFRRTYVQRKKNWHLGFILKLNWMMVNLENST